MSPGRPHDLAAVRGGLRVVAGGAPTQSDLAALTCALTAALDLEDAADADPMPTAYRSRWRRAAVLELTDVPVGLKDAGRAWT